MMELNRNYLPMYDWLDLLLVLCMHSFVINEKKKFLFYLDDHSSLTQLIFSMLLPDGSRRSFPKEKL